MTKAAATPPKAADRILGVAGELFYREGSRGVGVDEIVAKAGATKPTLYRAFGSKDQLIAAYLVDAHPGDPRAQILAYFDALEVHTQRKGYRGCGLSNAAVEYPDPTHAGRLVAVTHKAQMRKRLRDLTRAMDARKPKKLADSLLLLIEGVFVTSQLFGEDGPVVAARGAAEALIDAHVRKVPSPDPA
jgi:AcrR family transcriptional regulator